LFETYRNPILKSLRENDTTRFLDLLSQLNIRYIFYNSDPTLIENVRTFYDPSDKYSGSEIPDIIQTNSGYEALFSRMPLTKLYQKGFFAIYEIDSRVIRPLIYIEEISTISYTKHSTAEYSFSIDLQGRKAPFLLIMSNIYDDGWKLTLEGISHEAVTSHTMVHDYANGWIIDPAKMNGKTIVNGTITLVYQQYFYLGSIISGSTILLAMLISFLTRRTK
jgi:hypothetical protein